MEKNSLTAVMLICISHICCTKEKNDVEQVPIDVPTLGAIKTNSIVSSPGTLLFNSGFEPGSTWVNTTTQSERLTGLDNSLNTPNDWGRFCSSSNMYPYLGQFRVNYEGGDASKRKASIKTDPADATNKVMHYAIYEPNVMDSNTGNPAKARIEAQISGGSPGIKKYYQSFRVYFPSICMNKLKNYPTSITWFSLAEFWNDAAWSSSPYAHRLTVGMGIMLEHPIHFIFI